MIPIAFVTIAESMVMQLPPVDLGLVGVVIAAIALVITAITFYISHAHASRREQIETCMYMWERINEKYDPVVEIGSKGWPKDGSGLTEVPWQMLRSLFREIDFFAYLVVVDVIKDEKALSYFRFNLSDYIKVIMKHYASADTRHDLRDQYHYFNRLIKKWNIDVTDEET